MGGLKFPGGLIGEAVRVDQTKAGGMPWDRSLHRYSPRNPLILSGLRPPPRAGAGEGVERPSTIYPPLSKNFPFFQPYPFLHLLFMMYPVLHFNSCEVHENSHPPQNRSDSLFSRSIIFLVGVIFMSAIAFWASLLVRCTGFLTVLPLFSHQSGPWQKVPS